MSRYRPDSFPPVGSTELRSFLDRQLWRISQAIEQQFDNEPVWDDIWPLATSVGIGAAAPDVGTWNGSIETPLFDGIATPEYMSFAYQIPHAAIEGQILHPHVHWSTVDATANAAVVWTLEFAWANIGSTFGATSTVTATGSCSAALGHHVTEFSPITVSSGTISLMLLGRLGRDPGVAGDSFAHDAALLSFDIHGQFDGKGSVKEYTKL